MYKRGKIDGMHCVILKQSQIIQFRSLNQRRVSDWITANTPELKIPERDRRRKQK